MLTECTVKLQNNWFSNTLPIGTYSKKFLMQWVASGTIRNGCEFDSNCHTWTLLIVAPLKLVSHSKAKFTVAVP